MAMKIIEIAKENGVAVVERKPVAAVSLRQCGNRPADSVRIVPGGRRNP